MVVVCSCVGYLRVMWHGIARLELHFVITISWAAQVGNALQIKLLLDAYISQQIHLKAREADAVELCVREETRCTPGVCEETTYQSTC